MKLGWNDVEQNIFFSDFFFVGLKTLSSLTARSHEFQDVGTVPRHPSRCSVRWMFYGMTCWGRYIVLGGGGVVVAEADI